MVKKGDLSRITLQYAPKRKLAFRADLLAQSSPGKFTIHDGAI